MRRFLTALLACGAGLSAAVAIAQPPAPLDPSRFAFPGGYPSPASGASAALALADRWLGEEPFANPAVPRAFKVAFSPNLERVSRQDLRSDNRDVEEQAAFLDLAGGFVTVPLGSVTLEGYASQPELRRESNSYTLGRGLTAAPTAGIATDSRARERRAGLGFAVAAGDLRVGLAGEWTKRSDFYDYTETSGSPDQGHRRVEFCGGGIGAQAGVRLEIGPGGHRIALGAALRRVPEFDLRGTERHELLSDSSRTEFSLRRAAGWEGGVSARVAVNDAFRVLVAGGGRSAGEWAGFGVTGGAGAEWKLAGEYRDPGAPWSVRFGFGGEHQRGVSESRAGVLGLGLGWAFTRVQLDLGLTHRKLVRAGQPNSFDDRLVATVAMR